MSHLYPLAASAKAALDAPEHAALTRAEAVRQAEGASVSGLETEWLTLSADEADAALARAESGVGTGFVQIYEDASGTPVLAVTYWKLAETGRAKETVVSTPKPSQKEAEEADHTDDLYFRSGRTKKRGRRKKVDPNQMDLFGTHKE